MGKIKYCYEILEKLFYEQKVITLPMMKEALDVENRMTIFRKLKHLPYKASYSHVGKYYTLDTIANYDELGLWNYNDIFFSKYGSLLNTLEQLINQSEFGFYSHELERIVHVRVFNALQKLFNQNKIYRIQHGGMYLYLSLHDWQQQFSQRRKNVEHAISLTFNTFGKSEAVVNTQQCLLKLLQILNEKQRRLLAGFLSLCIGRGGDKLLSDFTAMNVKTIAKGKRELQLENVTMDNVRASGGGRKEIKKNKHSKYY
jgi:hypothetical protein